MSQVGTPSETLKVKRQHVMREQVIKEDEITIEQSEALKVIRDDGPNETLIVVDVRPRASTVVL